MGAECVAVLIVVYALAVRTAPGQRFEDAVLRAANTLAGSAEQANALNTLDVITVPSVVAGVVVIFLVGVLRRRLFLAVTTVCMIAVALVTTEAIQHLTYRPILLSHGYRREDQSFPSGHTTVAMALMCGLVLVVPYRVRGLAVAIGSLAAAGVGVATVTASWHRPSDTVGADLIVIGYACAAVAIQARCGRVREAALPTAPGRALRAVLAGACATVAALAFAVAAAVVAVALHASVPSTSGPAMLLAGRLLALSGSATVAVALLALLRHVDLGAPPADRPDEGSPDVESRPAGFHRPSGP